MPDITPLARAVREHATVLTSDADLAALDDVVGDARVVAVGEAAHFVAEFGDTQRRLVRHLARHHGFTVLAAEFGFSEAGPLDRWLHGEGTDADLAGLRGTPYSGINGVTTRWLREHNATSGHPLRFVGLDTPVAGGSFAPPLEPLIAFLERADPEVVPLARTALEIGGRVESRSQAGSAPLWAALPAADRTLLTATLSRLARRMDALRPLHVGRTGPEETDLARRHLDVAVTTDHMLAVIHEMEDPATALPMDGSLRDHLMAESLLWHLDRLGPDDRVILLAHDFHIQRTTIEWNGVPLSYPMGHYLAPALGDDYRTIALTHTARTAPDLIPTPGNEHGFVVSHDPVHEAPPTSVEGALIAAGLGDVATILPLSPLRDDPPTSLLAQSEQLPMDVLAAFDAVVTLPTATSHVELVLR